MIRKLLEGACPVVFIFLYDQGREGGMGKVMKIDPFKYFLPLWSVSPAFWGGFSANHATSERNG